MSGIVSVNVREKAGIKGEQVFEEDKTGRAEEKNLSICKILAAFESNSIERIESKNHPSAKDERLSHRTNSSRVSQLAQQNMKIINSHRKERNAYANYK